MNGWLAPSPRQVLVVSRHPAFADAFFTSIPDALHLQTLPLDRLRGAVEPTTRRLLRAIDALLVEWSGFDVQLLSSLRTLALPAGTPVIAACSANEGEQITALLLGADAALVGPVHPVLFEAKLTALSRLLLGQPAPSADEAWRLASGVEPDLAPEPIGEKRHDGSGPSLEASLHELHYHGHVLRLRPKEFEVLQLLVERPDVCMSRDELLDRVWGLTFETGTNIVDVQVYEVRKQLRRIGAEGHLQTIRGVGYRWLSRPHAVPETPG